ncbi:MAG: LUD domain-containing protein [Anaerolineales bacterium]
MVTTLPPIHIALISMERLVRNPDDLALMLSLLPRSATGQKLTSYTQIVHSPLQNQQSHFILLDNGRSRLRNSPLKELYCIRCGSCLNACPASARSAGTHIKSPYSGPIGSVISAGSSEANSSRSRKRPRPAAHAKTPALWILIYRSCWCASAQISVPSPSTCLRTSLQSQIFYLSMD